METSTLYERNQELLRRASEGDSEAEAALVEENLGLVRKVARRFLDRGTEYEDLVQIGTIGMIKAIRSFSPERVKTEVIRKKLLPTTRHKRLSMWHRRAISA